MARQTIPARADSTHRALAAGQRMPHDLLACSKGGDRVALPCLQASGRHDGQTQASIATLVLEAHEVRGIDDRRIVPGDADQFHVVHAAAAAANALELIVAHAYHHGRHARLSESLAVHERIDEILVHATERGLIAKHAARGRQWRTDRGHHGYQQPPSCRRHRNSPNPDGASLP